MIDGLGERVGPLYLLGFLLKKPLIRYSIQERIYGRIQVAEPDARGKHILADAFFAHGHYEKNDKVGQKAERESDDYGRQLFECLLLLVHEHLATGLFLARQLSARFLRLIECAIGLDRA